MTPTHELALQIFMVIENLSCYMDINKSLSVGGLDRSMNLAEYQEKTMPQLIVATPGRLYDIMRYSYDNNLGLFDDIRLFIMDEGDELLSGFQDNMIDICRMIPPTTIFNLFSATFTNDIVDLSRKIMTNPVKIFIKKENMTIEGILQTFVEVEDDNHKDDVLIKLLQSLQVDQLIIYVNSKQKAERIKNLLNDNNFSCDKIDGELKKTERIAILQMFKNGKIKYLVSTDLLSRGIDIQQLSLIINYELPRDPSCYIHRIGRSGRFGKKGVSINLINTNDQSIQERNKINNRMTYKTYNERSCQTIIQNTFKCKIEPLDLSIIDNY